jgi:polyprenyl-phospho-N-acetylgalactosaminyl synthase
MTPTVWIVIPAYNEERALGNVLDALRSAHWENILVVNDGSTDRTEAIARNASADVLSFLLNRGQGAALQAGIDYLSRTVDPDVIVTFDADGQHQAEDVARLVAPVIRGEADIALGSRFIGGGSRVPPARRAVLFAGVVFTWLVSDIFVTDTHNGLRALSRRAYRTIRLRHRGMEHASEIIDEIKRSRLRFREIPVRILYTPYAQQKGQRAGNALMLGIKFIVKRLGT